MTSLREELQRPLGRATRACDESTSDELIFQPTEPELDRAFLGRRRALGMLGGALFGGVATTLVNASPAYAAACSMTSPGSGCFGFKKCNCCSGTSCCASGCTPLTGLCPDVGWGGGPNYWYTCQSGYMFACADFCQTCSGGSGSHCPSGKSPCICRFYIGTC